MLRSPIERYYNEQCFQGAGFSVTYEQIRIDKILGNRLFKDPSGIEIHYDGNDVYLLGHDWEVWVVRVDAKMREYILNL